jgi:cyclic pyranopterin phosphate synthase
MVDVGAKPVTRREAEARAVVVFPRGARRIVLAGRGPKGPVLEVARTAAVLAAKRTDAIVPLCHSLPLDSVSVAFHPRGANALEIRVRAVCTGRTGVEMEALVGASVAALTVYDMSKAVDHGIRIERIELLEKTGGRTGTWRAPKPRARSASAQAGRARSVSALTPRARSASAQAPRTRSASARTSRATKARAAKGRR